MDEPRVSDDDSPFGDAIPIVFICLCCHMRCSWIRLKLSRLEWFRNSFMHTQWSDRLPSQRLFNHGIYMWEVRPIAEVGKPAAKNPVKLFLRLFLNLRIEYQCHEKRLDC